MDLQRRVKAEAVDLRQRVQAVDPRLAAAGGAVVVAGVVAPPPVTTKVGVAV